MYIRFLLVLVSVCIPGVLLGVHEMYTLLHVNGGQEWQTTAEQKQLDKAFNKLIPGKD